MTETVVATEAAVDATTSMIGRIPSVHSLRDIPFAWADETSTPAMDLNRSNSYSSLNDAHISNHSSRLVSVSDIPQPKHSSVIKNDDLYSLHETRSKLEADIELHGPTTINAIILSSVFERINAGFMEVLPALAQLEDTAQFSANYYPLRDVANHLQKVGPMGNVFPFASQLNQLIKWDFRQLINSFLTLVRTSPGFIATAYLDLGPMEKKMFLGYQRSDFVEEVMSAQRLSPLGILFHGMIRDSTERINYFAAVSSQLILEGHDQLFMTMLSKYSHPTFFSNNSATKLDIFLRKLIKSGLLAPRSSSTVGTCTSTATSISITATPQDSDFWNDTSNELLEILTDYVDPELPQFVATVTELSSDSIRPKIHAAVIKHFKNLTRTVLTNPHSYGLLQDNYISDQTQKTLLLPLCNFLATAIDNNDAFVASLCGTKLQLGDINSYYEHNQLIVLSLCDIVYLYGALLPPKKTSSPQTSSADGNEWCLENIQADLEPVMKELSINLPTTRSRIVRDQQGIFMEYWQVFKIEQDGLVNDMDTNSWCPEITDIPPLIVPEFASVETILATSTREAEARGEFVNAQALRQLAKAEKPLNAVVHELEKCAQLLTSHKRELHNILDSHTALFFKLNGQLSLISNRLNLCRLYIWYEQEVRNAPVYLRSQEIVSLLRGELLLQRSNSGSSHSSRRFSARPRRLSLLSGTSSMDSFFVSKDYLLKPKLADREIEVTMKFLRSEHVHNFCRSEELLHRFNCELFILLNRVVERDFLSSTSTCYKKDIRAQTHTPSSHRMSMSVLPDISSSSRSRNRKSSPNLLLDIFEWKSVDQQQGQADWSMGLDSGVIRSSSAPDKDLLTGLILSDLGSEFLSKGSETDEFMQQTGRMLLDGDGQEIQPVLEHISMQTTPKNKLKGIQTLIKVVRAKVERTSKNGPPSRHDVTHELTKLLGREPGTLFCDLQTISCFVPSSILENVDDGQPFWDVSEAALKVLDQVVGKSMDLATRMLRYNETVKSTSMLTTMGVNDAVSIWSFCARYGRPKAQRKLAELYLNYPHTILEVMPFTKPAILFEGIEPSHVRNVVIAHWMQIAAQKGESRAIEYCRQLQKIDFI